MWVILRFGILDFVHAELAILYPMLIAQEVENLASGTCLRCLKTDLAGSIHYAQLCFELIVGESKYINCCFHFAGSMLLVWHYLNLLLSTVLPIFSNTLVGYIEYLI